MPKYSYSFSLKGLFSDYRGDTNFATHRQLVKFFIVGAVNTSLDIFLYFILTRFTSFFSGHLLLAKAASYGTGSVTGFIFNRKWTFAKQGGVTVKEVVKFYISAGLALLINNVSSFFLLKIFYPYDLIAVILAAGITFLWNFTLAKFWVFTTDS